MRPWSGLTTSGRNWQHVGRAVLVRLIAAAQTVPTRSELEDAFLKVVRRQKLSVPATNVYVGPYRVDPLFGNRALAVELDGWATHKTGRPASVIVVRTKASSPAMPSGPRA